MQYNVIRHCIKVCHCIEKSVHKAKYALRLLKKHLFQLTVVYPQDQHL